MGRVCPGANYKRSVASGKFRTLGKTLELLCDVGFACSLEHYFHFGATKKPYQPELLSPHCAENGRIIA